VSGRWRKTRKQLSLEYPNRHVFLADHESSSPSAAAAVIQGGSANGLTSWKDSKGVSLKDKEAQEIQQDESTLLEETSDA